MTNIKQTTWVKIIISILLLAVIVLASVLFARIQDDAAKNTPYTIGSPVTPATQLPMGMVMKTFPVASSEPTPTLSFDINQDTMEGWDVDVHTTNFTFAPEHINGVPVAGEGHVHLYIDNNLIIMLGPWYHIDHLSPGQHIIRVGLFNNDHSIYTVNGARVEVEKTINVGAQKMANM
jgi:hypothetical protein